MDPHPTEHELVAQRLWGCSRVPMIHRRKINDWQGTPWGDALKRVMAVRGEGRIVLVTGARGTGKTQLAAAAIGLYCRALIPSRYTLAFEIFLTLRESMTSRDTSDRKILEELARWGLLVIDEIHQRKGSAWEHDCLSYLIDRRYSERRDTMLITNEETQAALVKLGPSIASRIQEVGAVLECNWESFRRLAQ